MIEFPRIVGNVESEAMRHHPSRAVHANGADLPLIPDPHSGESVDTMGLDAEGSEGFHDRLLDLPQEPMKILFEVGKMKQQIADELTGIVDGDISAAVIGNDVDAEPAKPIHIRDDMTFLRGTSHGYDRRVLTEHERTRPCSLFDFAHVLALPVLGLGIVDHPPVFTSYHSSRSPGFRHKTQQALRRNGEELVESDLDVRLSRTP